MAAGAIVNVVTSYFAATVTGQSFSICDGLAAAASGALCAFGPGGAIAAGVVSCAYSAYMSYTNGADWYGVIITGITSGLCAGAGIGNIVGLDQTTANLGIQILMDSVFCTGYNSISAAVYKSVTVDVPSTNNEPSSPKSKPSLVLHSATDLPSTRDGLPVKKRVSH